MTLPHTQGSHRNTLRSSNTAANGRIQRKREKSNFTHFLSLRKPPPSQSSEPPSRAPLCCPAPRARSPGPAPSPAPRQVFGAGGGGVCYGACFFPSLSPPPPPFLWKRQAVRLHAPHGVTALSPRARWTPLVREWLSEMRTYSPPPAPPRPQQCGSWQMVQPELLAAIFLVTGLHKKTPSSSLRQR